MQRNNHKKYKITISRVLAKKSDLGNRRHIKMYTLSEKTKAKIYYVNRIPFFPLKNTRSTKMFLKI